MNHKKNCIDCINFKMKPGWEKAYCSIGMLIFEEKENDKDRLFKWMSKSGKNLVERGYKMRCLQGCNCFEKV